MPLFFFNLRDGGERFDDQLGSEFASLELARKEAERSAREMMAENMREGRTLDHQEIDICDTDGQVIETVRFRDVLKAIGGLDD